jgi:dolichol-phosphate mannosyltransferase
VRVSLKDNTIDLSVVIPTLNEGPNLEQLLPQLIAALREMKVDFEVLVVDANSPDGTREIAAREGAIYVPEDEAGYGAAILRGVAEARGAYVLTMDADQSHPADVVRTLWAVRDKADITIASRYVPGGRADQTIGRLVLSRILNSLFRRNLDMPVKDLSSGFRLYRKAVFGRLDLDFTNFVVLIDILIKAHALGFTAQEVPFHYRPRATGASKARILKFGRDYLRLFFRL